MADFTLGIDASLSLYIRSEILPRYDRFDAAHRRDHAEMVISQSLDIARHYDEDINMVYCIAAYHDTGLVEGRDTHHIASGRIVRSDERLLQWFNSEQINIMAEAVEDHRASSDHAPRSIYGKIVAEADRFIEPEKIIMRTIQYGRANYPKLNHEQQWQRTLNHLREKYGDGGYLRLWIPESPNAERLEALRKIIRNEHHLRELFEIISTRI